MRYSLPILCVFAFFVSYGTVVGQSSNFMRNWSPKAAVPHCMTPDPSAPDNSLPDFSPVDDSCVDFAVKKRVAGELASVADWFETGKFHNPDYLRPITKIGQNPHLVLYANKSAGPGYYAGYAVPCDVIAKKWDPSLGGYIAFNPNPSVIVASGGLPFAVLAHEMAHASQFASGFSKADPRFCAGTAAAGILNWVREGTADAIGWEYLRTYYPKEWKLSANQTFKFWRRIAGLRPYDYPLQFLEADSADENSTLFLKHQYYTSAFWRHLAWRYHGGEVRFLSEYLSSAIDAPFDWTSWADQRIRNDSSINPPKPNQSPHGFYVTYPTFIADWAGMHATKRFESLKSAAPVWLREMFGHCPEQELSKDRGGVFVETELRNLSAKCFKLVFKSLAVDELATVRILAAPQAGIAPEEFHLSEVERTGKIPSRCAEMLDKKKQVIAGADCVVNRSITTATGRPILFTPQALYGGDGKNSMTLILSRASLSPTDADAKKNPGKIKLWISTDFGQVAMGGKGVRPVHPVFVESRLWSESTMPMDIQPETMAAQEGKMNFPGAAPSAMGQGVFSTEMFTAFNPLGDGAWAMSFASYDVQVDAGSIGASVEMEDGDKYSLYFESGTQLQEGQSYRSYVTVRSKPSSSLVGILTGAGASPWKSRREFEPTIVTVKEHSEDRLTVDFKGRICFGQGLGGGRPDKRKCMSIEPFSGTVSVAFPKLYTRDGLLRYDRQSEGNRIYRDRRAAWMNAVLGQAFSGSSGGAGGSPFGGGGASSAGQDSPLSSIFGKQQPGNVAACDCSCDGMEKLKDQMGGANPAQALSFGGCFFQCMAEYSKCNRR